MTNLPLHSEFEYYQFKTLVEKLPHQDMLGIGEDIIIYYIQQKKVLLMMFYSDKDSEFIIDKNTALESHTLNTRLHSLWQNPLVPRKPIIDLLLKILDTLYEHKKFFRSLLDNSYDRTHIITQLLKQIEVS